jgi:hypothetical protein
MYAFFNYVNEKGLQMDAVQAKNRKYYADPPFISIEEEDLEGILSFIQKKDTGRLNVMVMNDSSWRETFFWPGEIMTLQQLKWWRHLRHQLSWNLPKSFQKTDWAWPNGSQVPTIL